MPDIKVEFTGGAQSKLQEMRDREDVSESEYGKISNLCKEKGVQVGDKIHVNQEHVVGAWCQISDNARQNEDGSWSFVSD